jgi:hypothetical protein
MSNHIKVPRAPAPSEKRRRRRRLGRQYLTFVSGAAVLAELVIDGARGGGAVAGFGVN